YYSEYKRLQEFFNCSYDTIEFSKNERKRRELTLAPMLYIHNYIKHTDNHTKLVVYKRFLLHCVYTIVATHLRKSSRIENPEKNIIHNWNFSINRNCNNFRYCRQRTILF